MPRPMFCGEPIEGENAERYREWIRAQRTQQRGTKAGRRALYEPVFYCGTPRPKGGGSAD